MSSGLNFVEMIVVAAAAQHVIQNDPHYQDPFEQPWDVLEALNVVAEGMKRSGFQYRSGVLKIEFNRFYEGLASVSFLQNRKDS